MSTSSTVDIPEEFKQSMRRFRFKRRSGTAAFIAKVNKNKLIIEEDEQLEGITVEDLVEELPESSPRFVLYVYPLEHGDRKSFPLVLINWAPPSCQTGMLTLHASAFMPFQQIADANKVIEVRDGAEGFTTEILKAKLLA